MNLKFSSRFLLLLCLLCLRLGHAGAQVSVVDNQTATALVQKLLGTGVITLNETLNCPGAAEGIFTVTPAGASNLGLDSGLILTSGTAVGVIGPNPGFGGPGSSSGGTSDADLTTLSGHPTFDACILEFDFVPSGDTVLFDYVFASTEYDGYSCSSFNDAFGFFISGPGITGSQNIAVVPGTTIPVTVNSTTDPAYFGAFSTAACTAMGPGSPFSQYLVQNLGGATIAYPGFTQIFTALSAVIPCDTYHLKLAIADASDSALDSGVFLKAGSLSATNITIAGIGTSGLNLNGQPIAVRGCNPAQFVLSVPAPLTDTLNIHYIISGTATNGVDYTMMPDSVIIPTGGTTAYVPVYAQHTGSPTDTVPESVIISILSPYTCGTTGLPVIIATDTIMIIDSLPVHILNPDTAICAGQCVQIDVDDVPLDSLLNFYWTPAAGVNDPATGLPNPYIREPLICPPAGTTTYTLHSYIPTAGCDTPTTSIIITIKQPAVVNIGPDLVTCLGTPVQLNATAQPATQPYSYVWTSIPPPAVANLSNPGIPDPIYTPVAGDVGTTLQLIATADPGVGGSCKGSDTIAIRVLPNDFTLSNHDTTICFGASVQINATGDTAFSYLWAPTAGVTPPNIINPLITPTETTTYTVTASYPTCPDIVKDLTISVEPSPTVNIGPDLSKCQWDTLQLHAFVTPAGYPLYTYTWSPDSNLDMGNVTDVVFSGQASATLTFSVRTPAGCSAQDQIDIIVHQGNFATLLPGSDVGICPGDSVQLTASGGVFYNWTPGLFLSDSTTANPVSHPFSDVSYNLLVTDQYGCYDTLGINIDLHPGALLELGDTVLLYPGDSVQFNPGGNCLYYTWFPPLGLSNDSISNPVAMPEVDTRYFVTAMTEWGCATSDSVDVRIAYDSELDVPNAFIPGTAGKNSTIAAVHLGLASVKYFQIFDRWGVKVFDTQDINEGWDGSLNGTPQPMGVYVYQVEGYTFRGKKVKKSGNITLVR